MSDLEKISQEAVPAALEKATRYRLLNEPFQAESICLDVLAVDSKNQEALATLLLALSDQFVDGSPGAEFQRTRDLLSRLTDEYQRDYYAGLLAERRATALIRKGGAHRGHVAYNLLREAIDWYDKARRIAPPKEDDAVLRRNTCVRMIEKNPHVAPAEADPTEMMLE